jgi:hypothetical protein
LILIREHMRQIFFNRKLELELTSITSRSLDEECVAMYAEGVTLTEYPASHKIPVQGSTEAGLEAATKIMTVLSSRSVGLPSRKR